MAGTKWATVTPYRAMVSRRWAASLWPPGCATTSRAPVISGRKSSQTETSKPVGVFWSRASPGPIPYLRAIQRSLLTMARWVLGTPLGRPVEPEV